MGTTRKRLWRSIALAAAVTISLPLPISVMAQNDGVREIEEVVVTGSRIRRADIENSSPVISISADDIQDIGFSSIQDVLADLPQNSGGSLDQQQTFGFTPSASGVDLRGAGLGRSLTLINGKRLPKYPIAAGGTDNFTDTSNIPLGAVERVEILTSGGSAIYGSDAMGGVVNVILKDSFEGLQINAKYGDTAEGGREIMNTSIVAGTNSDLGNVMFFLEHETREALTAPDRNNYGNLGTDLAFNHPFSAYSTYGISLRDFSNTVVATLDDATCTARGLQPRSLGGAPICGFNRSGRRDLFPEMERTSALVNYKFNVTDSASFYGSMAITHGETDINIEPMPVDEYTFFVGSDENGTADPGFVTGLSDRSGTTARFPQATAFGGDFAGLADGGYFYTRRMLEFGNRRTHSEVDNINLISGFEGAFNDWRWNVDGQFARVSYEDQNNGYASADSYFSFLTSGASGRSPFDLMTPAEVAGAAYTPFTDAESTFTGFSASLDGDLFEMPAGPVSAAFGVETFREWFSNQSDTESLKGNILATGGSSGEGARDYDALYAEFLIPVIDNVDVTFALRYDNYSDFGNNTSPQLGVEYRPIEGLLVRALWADTFRAPDLQRVYGDPTAAFSQVTDPLGCRILSGTADGDPTPLDPDSPIQACAGEAFVEVAVGPNSELDAETGTNWNVGAVWSSENFDASIDYWHLEIDDIVNDLSAQQIVTDYLIYESLIIRDTTGVVESVNATAQNLSFRETNGIDFSAGYRFPTEDLGFFRLKLTGSYLLDYDEQFSVTDPVESIIDTDRVPEWRAQINLGWDIADLSTNLYFNYIGKMNGTNVEEGFGVDGQIEDQWKINWSANYQMDNIGIRAGINNLTDASPEVDYTDFGWPFYPQEYFNAIGREFYVSANYQFGN